MIIFFTIVSVCALLGVWGCTTAYMADCMAWGNTDLGDYFWGAFAAAAVLILAFILLALFGAACVGIYEGWSVVFGA